MRLRGATAAAVTIVFLAGLTATWGAPAETPAPESPGPEAPPGGGTYYLGAMPEAPVQVAPPSPGLYDPMNGYFYYPGVRPGMVTITIGSPDGPQSTYYLNTGATGPLPSQYYAALAERLRTAPPAPGGMETPIATAPAAGQPARGTGSRRAGEEFRSRLSPMLGGSRDVSLTFALGEAKLQEGRYADAAAAFVRAAAAAPGAAAPHLALSLALAADGRYQAAGTELRTGVALVTDWPSIKLDPAVTFGGGGPAQAFEGKVTTAARTDAADNDLQLLLAFVYFATGRGADAEKLLQPQAAAAPEDRAVGRFLAAAEARAKEGGRPTGGAAEGQQP